MSLQNTDDKKDDQDKQHQAPSPHNKDAESREGSPAERLLDHIIARYGAEPRGIAKGVLQLSPSERDDVMQVIHHRFGNGFVHQVEIEIGKLNNEREGQAAPESLPPPSGETAAAEHAAAEAATARH
jgi:hypothetical protein